jgi:HEAT repeat protein
VNDRLAKTMQVLAATGNEAAVDVLLVALDSPHAEIQEGALTALLDRWSAVGQREVVRRWNRWDESRKNIICERPGRIHDALRDAILGHEPQLFTNACDIVLWAKEYDLLPALLTASEDRGNPLGDEAARTLLALADLLFEELASPRGYLARRDPQLIRQHLLTSLETSVARFDQHKRREALDAFLILAGRDNPTLKRILGNPHDRSFLPLVEALTTSRRAGVMKLLLAHLDDPHSPHAALGALAHRADEPFVRLLLKKVGVDPTPAVKANLRRIETIPWLREDLRRLTLLGEVEQQAVMQLAAASGMKRLQVFEVTQYLLRHGNLGGRRAASLVLAEFKGVEANLVAMQALDDADPQVQVNILLQLRERGIPSAMSRLLELIDSPHAIVREAARDCLAEFNFKRFLAAFDLLTPEVRISTGQLVRKVDRDAIDLLKDELASPGRGRRLRALQMVACMEVAPQLEQELTALLCDEDHFVRIEAATLLVACDTPLTRQALRAALLDRNVSVQEAAERSLKQIAEQAAARTFALGEHR